MIEIKNFNGIEDFFHMNRWLYDRDHPTVQISDMPEITFMAWWENKRVATMSLRRCEGGFAILDSIATDPKIMASVRDSVLDYLMEHTLGYAENLGIKSIIGFSIDTNTVQRARNHGFKETGYTCMSKELK